MKSSIEWKHYFQQNLKNQRINWNQKPQITAEEKRQIIYSLKAWQKGETSDGSHLKKAAAKYASKHADPDYLEAINLFIKEEQKHGENLGLYIDAIGEKRVKFDLGDYAFRSVRYFLTNMEIWTITVLIVESAAQVFYQSLKNASNCSLLKEICTDILIDEAEHIDFQAERLFHIYQAKSNFKQTVSYYSYRVLFEVVVLAIWLSHKKAFRAGGYTHSKYEILMRKKFLNILTFVTAYHPIYAKA